MSKVDRDDRIRVNRVEMKKNATYKFEINILVNYIF